MTCLSKSDGASPLLLVGLPLNDGSTGSLAVGDCLTAIMNCCSAATTTTTATDFRSCFLCQLSDDRGLLSQQLIEVPDRDVLIAQLVAQCIDLGEVLLQGDHLLLNQLVLLLQPLQLLL